MSVRSVRPLYWGSDGGAGSGAAAMLHARALPCRPAGHGLRDACVWRGMAWRGVACLELPVLELLVGNLHERGPVDALDKEGVRVIVFGAL